MPVLSGPWKMKRGALYPALRVTFRRADRQPLDLSAVGRVDFVMRRARALVPIIEEQATVMQVGEASDGLDVGVCQYDWQPGDTDLSGVYRAEFALYDPDGTPLARVPNDSYLEVQILGNLSEAAGMDAAKAPELSALPEPIDLRLYAGDDFAISVTVTEASGEPAVLDGALIRAQIRRSAASGEVLGEFAATSAADTLLLRLPAALTATLPTRAVYDCEWVDRALTLIRGRIKVEPQVSRDG